MRKKKSTKKWFVKHSKDKYVKLSHTEGYRSRAYHKLLEINEKYKILKSANNIIDLGSSPGSWSEYISREFNGKTIVAIDLIDMRPIKNRFLGFGLNVHEVNGHDVEIIQNSISLLF